MAVGFGRTGTLFACEQRGGRARLPLPGQGPDRRLPAAGGDPDDRGGLLGLLATAAEGKTFYHGHTYGGNPLGAAVALASLQVFDDEATLESLLPRRSTAWRQRLAEFATLPHVGDVRQCGLIAGIELVADKATKRPYPWSDQVGARVCRQARDFGLLIRPLGDVLVVMPPLAITSGATGRDARRDDTVHPDRHRRRESSGMTLPGPLRRRDRHRRGQDAAWPPRSRGA